MKKKSAKPRLIREAVKDQHTSHWDQDLLSWQELEQLLDGNEAPDEELQTEDSQSSAAASPATTSKCKST